MNTINKMTDENLIFTTKQLVAEDRLKTLEVISLSVIKTALKTAIKSLKSKRQTKVIQKQVVSTNTKHSRYIPKAVKQAVWKKKPRAMCLYRFKNKTPLWSTPSTTSGPHIAIRHGRTKHGKQFATTVPGA